MSRGNKVIACRVTKEMFADMIAAIKGRNVVTRQMPWKLADFLIESIKEKLAHMKRSRCKHKKLAVYTSADAKETAAPPIQEGR